MVSQILQKNERKIFDLIYHSSKKSNFFIFSFVFLEKLGKHKLLSRLSDLQPRLVLLFSILQYSDSRWFRFQPYFLSYKIIILSRRRQEKIAQVLQNAIYNNLVPFHQSGNVSSQVLDCFVFFKVKNHFHLYFNHTQNHPFQLIR